MSVFNVMIEPHPDPLLKGEGERKSSLAGAVAIREIRGYKLYTTLLKSDHNIELLILSKLKL